MSDSTPAENLTSWAAASPSKAVHVLRTTIGPLLLILFTPPVAILFWIVCTFEPFNGALSPLLTAPGWRSIAAHWPWPSPVAAVIVLIFLGVEFLLLRFLPGRDYQGPITPS